MTTISANSSSGIVLTSPGYTNPVVVDAGVTITGALDGNGIAAYFGNWTIANGGTVDAIGTNGAAVYLAAGGVVTNQGTGVIGLPSSNLSAIYILGDAGTVTNFGTINAGVWLASGGAVSNQPGGRIISGSTSGYGVGFAAGGTVTNAALISGSLVGIDVSEHGGTVANETGGTITGQYAGMLMGVVGQAGSGGRYVTNQAAATISGDSGVLSGGSSSATIINAGVIVGTLAGTFSSGGITLVVGAGVSLSAGGSVTNQPGGTIAGASYGVDISGGAGTVVNAGSISSGSLGVLLSDGGVITNQSSGSIYGATHGVEFSTVAGTLINYGSISSGPVHAAVDLTAGGKITNEAGGRIQGGGGNAIYAINAAVTVANAGVIVAGTAGTGVKLLVGGLVSNASTGTISSNGEFGVVIESVVGTVYNAGRIAAGSAGEGVELLAGGLVTNVSGGTISASNKAGVYITGATGTVINAGLIVVSQTHSPVDLLKGGYVSNAQTGTISADHQDGVYVTGAAGTVVNYGTILSTLSDGVVLRAGGLVTNQSTGTISGGSQGYGFGGVYMKGAAGTVINAGFITNSAVNGIGLKSGGIIINQPTGTIRGATDGVYVSGGAGTVINSGNVEGNLTSGISFVGTMIAFASGVDLLAGGTITNQSSGSISGYIGIYGGGLLTVVNAGIVAGNETAFTGIGVVLAAGGSIINQSTATISGYEGIYGGGGSTLVNAGTIIGIDGTAVMFEGGHTNRVVIDPGAGFSGTVDGGNTIGATAVSTLELASGTSAGILSDLGSEYLNFAQTMIDAGASWSLTGANTVAAGSTLTELSGASLTDTGTLVNNGAIVLDPSTMTVAGLTGTGSVTIEAGSTLDVQGTIANAETVVFGGIGAYLHLEDPDSTSGSVTNFDVGETIDLKGIGFGSIRYANGLLSFEGDSFAVSLAPGNTELGSTTSTDGAEIFVLCFCANTQILTPSGERPVQDLAVGDMVTTHTGATRPIVWIGIGKVLATRGRRNAATPVIVRKGALTDNVPNRDLRVTKGHAFLLDDVLIPVEFLVNHRSIAWDDRAQEVELYHIELDTHDVLVANGAPAESYRDDGNRWLFRNANSGWGLPPLQPCAPVLTGGPLVDAVWRRLLDRSGPRPGAPLTDDPDLHLLADGERLDMTVRAGEACVFTLPAVPSALRIVSRAAAPAELGLVRDPRVLGVALRRVALRKGRLLKVIEAVDDRFTGGFHAFEADNGFRWTNGDATLPTEMFAGFIGPLELVLHIGGSTRYLADARTQQAA